ncbi:hypothetical protein CSOJ01_10479 [Colletotrichum sojae]|uniref:Uncharacterized protein n=1 Tax=Colletotrichum sojae TaxID=2175907 RepID=A0A8H6J007_9PEZI|nr:hypothetical protein CSOJ01_10479 [Colletotrichum sojae]
MAFLFQGAMPPIPPNLLRPYDPNNPHAPPPTPLEPEIKALYVRAVENPSVLTLAEKYRVLGRLPPDQEDEICMQHFGLTWGELIAKALADPEELSKEELDVICDGVQTKDLFHGVWYFGALPYLSLEEDKLKRHALRRAREALDYESAEPAAKERALGRRRAINESLAEESYRYKWISKVMDAGLPRWGFVVFRTGYDAKYSGDAAWERFRELYDRTGETMMGKQWRLSGRNLWKSHECVFVSEAGLHEASSEELRSRFRAMGEKEEIPEGIRRDCFLVVDEDVITWMDEVASKGKECQGSRWTVFLRAVNADYKGKEKGDLGEISVPLPKVCDWLYYTLFAQTETWQQLHRKIRTRRWKENRRSNPKYPAY